MTIDLTRFGVAWRAARRRRNRPTNDAPPTDPVIGLAGERPVTWPRPSADRASHVLVLAASGAGKTVLVAAALLEEVLDDE